MSARKLDLEMLEALLQLAGSAEESIHRLESAMSRATTRHWTGGSLDGPGEQCESGFTTATVEAREAIVSARKAVKFASHKVAMLVPEAEE